MFFLVRQADLTIKPTKCYLGYEYLGFEVKNQEDTMNRMRNAPIPTTKIQARSFLGLAVYYCKFVDGYSKIATPLTDLTRAKQPREIGLNKVSWSEKANKSFNHLKQAPYKALILKLPDMNKPFILRTYASDTGLAALLLQAGNGTLFPVAFDHNKLSPSQRRYSVV